MSLDRVHPCFGRKRDIAELQHVFHAILKGRDVNSFKKCPDCSTTVFTECSSHTESDFSLEEEGTANCSSSIVEVQYQRHSVGRDCRLILISGPYGTGKGRFVSESLYTYSTSGRCPHHVSLLQVSGQFRTCQEEEDQRNPYTKGRTREFENSLSAFHDALREMIDFLLHDIDMIHAVLAILKGSLNDPEDIVLLTEVFPFMRKLLSLDPMYQVNKVNPESYFRVFLQGEPSTTDRLRKLCSSLALFLQAVSSCIPVVFLLEDLQHADAASLVLIETLLNHEAFCLESRSAVLFLVATNSTDSNEPILHDFQSFQHVGKSATTENRTSVDLVTSIQQHKIHYVSLSYLSWNDVHDWALSAGGIIQQLSMDQKRAVTDLIFHQTNGCPLYVQFMLQYLQEDKALMSDPINKKSVPSTMAALYTSILLRQNDSVLHLVRCAAVLSHHSEAEVIDCDVLRVAMKKACGDVVLQANECCLLDFFPSRGYVRFSRKELQVAAYKTVADTAALHHEIGRCLWKDAIHLRDRGMATDDEMKRMLLRAALHLRYMDLASGFEERMQISKLCYEYGLHSTLLGDFSTSARLFEFAIYVLGQDLWRYDLYETCLVLHNAAAQTYFYVCMVDEMEQTLDAIFCNARRFEDKIHAYIVLVYAKSKGQMKDGFRIISDVLTELGEPINPKPSTFSIIKTLLRLKWLLSGKDFDFLSNLPDANENNQIITHFLSFAMFFIVAVEPKASLLLCSRLICLSVKNGITGPAAVAFAQYGYMLSGQGKLEEGHQFSQLALSFADRFEVWRPRIYCFVHGLTNFWTSPLRDSMNPMYQAQCDALKYGDMQSYGVLAGLTISLLLKQGAPLEALQSDAKSFCQSLAKVEQLSPLFVLVPHWSVINDLTGSCDSLNIPGEIQDTETLLKFAAKEGANVLIGRCYADRVMFCFLVGDYEQSLDMASKVHELRKLTDFHVMFYEGLASSALSWTLKSYKRQKCINRCRKIVRSMKVWADRCPENFRNKQLLLDAEIAAFKKEYLSALTLYEESAYAAKHEGFIQEEGIAYERLGLYQLHLGNSTVAKLSLERARSAFDKWGAAIVVDRIDKLLASFVAE